MASDWPFPNAKPRWDWSDMSETELERLREALRRVDDYCAGMLAALDAEPYAPDLPTLGEALRDIQDRALIYREKP